MVDVPKSLWMPHEPFVEDYDARADEGMQRLRHASVAIVGLARNCASPLPGNLERAAQFGSMCKQWQLHIEANDCEDQTLDVLAKFSSEHRQATFHYQVLGRQHYPSEFAGRRTIALAEYRTACQRWVRACAGDSDYVIVVDFDAWGGWNERGLMNGIGWLVELPGAFGMASVSLFEGDFGGGRCWHHYDLWALRGVGQPRCYYDTYRNGYGNWGFSWLPPVGSSPVIVASAFGGLAIYRTEAYLRGTYAGEEDVEHVPFHHSIARETGQNMYLNPSQRMMMHWLPEAANAEHSVNSV
jgi:hypothetical protein